MEKVQGWCTSNDMVINTMKSKSIIMGSSKKIQYLESNFSSFFDDVLLNHVKYEKILLIIVCLGVSKLIILFQRFHQGLD